MRLVIKNGPEELEIPIHPAILQALWDGETELKTAYTGWSMQGFRCTVDEPLMVRTRECPDATPSRYSQDCGMLDITLSKQVDQPYDPGFLPYDKVEAQAIRNRVES